MGAMGCSMWTDGQTKRHGEAKTTFCKFTNVPLSTRYLLR